MRRVESIRKPVLKTASTDSKLEIKKSGINGSQDLQQQLQKERQLRESAERKANAMAIELEELSQTLFEEANTMVANERKEKAELEKQLKMFDEKESSRRNRLSLLEDAIVKLTRLHNAL